MIQKKKWRRAPRQILRCERHMSSLEFMIRCLKPVARRIDTVTTQIAKNLNKMQKMLQDSVNMIAANEKVRQLFGP